MKHSLWQLKLHLNTKHITLVIIRHYVKLLETTHFGFQMHFIQLPTLSIRGRFSE